MALNYRSETSEDEESVKGELRYKFEFGGMKLVRETREEEVENEMVRFKIMGR